MYFEPNINIVLTSKIILKWKVYNELQTIYVDKKIYNILQYIKFHIF